MNGSPKIKQASQMPKQIRRAAAYLMTKTLTLSSHYRFDSNRKAVIVPSLKLSGKWLAKAGFQVSKLVRVEVQHGKMIITSIED